MNLPDKTQLLAEMLPHRTKWGPQPADVAREPTAADEESVWDYPRPPVIEPVTAPIRIVFAGATIAATTRAQRVLETAGAPVYYLPREDVSLDCLELLEGYTACEWKGAAVYYDVIANGQRARRAAFCYPDPFDDLKEGYAAIAGRISFYADKLDCYLADEKALPQPGGVYSGWITQNIKGPVKGGPGTTHW